MGPEARVDAKAGPAGPRPTVLHAIWPFDNARSPTAASVVPPLPGYPSPRRARGYAAGGKAGEPEEAPGNTRQPKPGWWPEPREAGSIAGSSKAAKPRPR